MNGGEIHAKRRHHNNNTFGRLYFSPCKHIHSKPYTNRETGRKFVGYNNEHYIASGSAIRAFLTTANPTWQWTWDSFKQHLNSSILSISIQMVKY